MKKAPGRRRQHCARGRIPIVAELPDACSRPERAAEPGLTLSQFVSRRGALSRKIADTEQTKREKT
jgi:hypothetical protein